MNELHSTRKQITPDHLYRYRAFSTHNVEALAENSVWLSTPKSFNDPFDCALSLDASRFGESLAYAVEQAVRNVSDLPPTAEQFVEHPGDLEAFEAFRLNLLESQQSRGVLSLTEVPDSLLMWAHYGDSHKGFCIEYDAVQNSELSDLARPVNYVDELPSLTAGDLLRGRSGDALDALWLTKARCWYYERKWRVLATQGNKKYRAPHITGLIFGLRMEDEARLAIRDALGSNRNVCFKEAVIAPGHFAVEIRDVVV